MSDTHRRARIDWGHIVLILFFAGITIAYFADAWEASASVRNLVLIFPASVLSLVLCVIVAVSVFREGSLPAEASAGGDTDEAEVPTSFIDRFRPGLLMALFALYVLTLPWLGFDVGSAVFVAAALLLDGERQLLRIAAVSIVFSFVATELFSWLLPYPMPLLIL